jgi:hypothetical protein
MFVQVKDGRAQFTENAFPLRPGQSGHLKLSEKLQGPLALLGQLQEKGLSSSRSDV